MTDQEQIDLVNRKVRELGEFFGSVQVLVSKTEDEGGGTTHIYSGGGNWFARQGMAHDFIKREEAETHAQFIASKMNPPEDDSEAWKK